MIGRVVFVVAAFRADVARAGAGGSDEVFGLVEELCRTSPEFAALWEDNGIVVHAGGIKRIHHPEVGPLELEFSSFAVEGRTDLGMIVYNPATPAVVEKVRALILAKR